MILQELDDLVINKDMPHTPKAVRIGNIMIIADNWRGIRVVEIIGDFEEYKDVNIERLPRGLRNEIKIAIKNLIYKYVRLVKDVQFKKDVIVKYVEGAFE